MSGSTHAMMDVFESRAGAASRPVRPASAYGELPPRSATTAHGTRLAEIISAFASAQRRRKPGDYLFRAGDTFHFFYVLSEGFAKSCYVTEDGRQRTTGLHLRGDILGMDAIANATHGCDAIALDACEVLTVPYDTVRLHCQRNPELAHELLRAFSTEIRNDRELMLSMSTFSAEGRVATLLLEMSCRCASRGLSATKLQLHLSRQEIGSMLGLTLETVSRAFSRLARLGLITVCLRDIVLLDHEGLLDITTLPAALPTFARGLRDNFVTASKTPALVRRFGQKVPGRLTSA
ncbi:MAG: helix-turn-helix domain-containing protein [Burkholderiales bacterium]|nr:helix-turn-helix domain-containing protein [Burkholderiales bacterium]